MQQHKEGIHSPDNLILLKNIDRGVPTPKGVRFTAKEFKRWDAYTKTRLPRDWSEFDLMQILNLIRAESELDQIRFEMSKERMVVTTSQGNLAAHPLITIINTKERLNRELMSHLKLYGDVRDLNSSFSQNKKAKQLQDLDNEEPQEGLLA